MITTWANFNGVLAANIYRNKDQPWYRTGHSIVLALLAVGLVGGSIANYTLLRAGNKKKAKELGDGTDAPKLLHIL